MKQFLLIIGMWFALMQTGFAQAPSVSPEATPKPAEIALLGEKKKLKMGALERDYWVYMPKKQADGARPLIVVLQGAGLSTLDMARSTGFSALAEKEGIILAYPEGMGHVPSWNGGKCCGYAERKAVDDVSFIRNMVSEITRMQAVDKTRIYAVGLSSGGAMVHRLACEMSSTFAAVAAVSAPRHVEACDPVGRPSIFMLHMMDDEIVPFSGGIGRGGHAILATRRNAPHPSAESVVAYWAEALYCRNYPAKAVTDLSQTVTYYCGDDRNIVLHTPMQGGHGWPEPAEHYTRMIWEFFKDHPPKRY